ncbi:hypothetical protein L1987_59365 [Smallanthus sonchifolius]|uniref:Uncharacterized protein n=1 Tax=Smallanthus sonchifolius TaxID=185202 RepID=A0ACB9D5A5_9ASTR|nr:hypothetical protein L1987_59365 [Smallanthus sonchifolius]
MEKLMVNVTDNKPCDTCEEPEKLLKAYVEACRRNVKFNGSVAIANGESDIAYARVYMLTHSKEYDME